MGADFLLQLAAGARRAPQTTIKGLGALSGAERLALLHEALGRGITQTYRTYSPDTEAAIYQLVANEFIATPQERCWEKFFTSTHPQASRFNTMYQEVWKRVAHYGEATSFSSPTMLTYVLQTIVARRGDPIAVPTPILRPLAQCRTPQFEILHVVQHGSMPLFICGGFELLPEARKIIADELSQMTAWGYRWPGAISLRESPGGVRRTNKAPCKTMSRWPGSHLQIGVVPTRMPCTLRHELMHEVRAQLSKETLDRVEKLYDQAMRADFGLIFNDEYYMHRYLHAGHPMQDSNEFFASAAHAYSHHPVALLETIHGAPPPVQAYAQAMVQLLKNKVF